MRRILLGCTLGISMLSAAGAAQACSVVQGYRIPTHQQLVDEADAIVVARAEAADGADAVRFSVLSRVKGAAPDTLVLPGLNLGNPPPSDPDEIVRANPEAMFGACIRRSFKAGERYVLFLTKRPDGTLMQMGHPFARVNEDYFGEDSAWMQVIREDLAATKAPHSH